MSAEKSTTPPNRDDYRQFIRQAVPRLTAALLSNYSTQTEYPVEMYEDLAAATALRIAKKLHAAIDRDDAIKDAEEVEPDGAAGEAHLRRLAQAHLPPDQEA